MSTGLHAATAAAVSVLSGWISPNRICQRPHAAGICLILQWEGRRKGPSRVWSCLCILSINQSSEIPSGAARNNTKLFCSIGFDVALKCASLLPSSLPRLSLSLTLNLQLQPPCEICLVICVSKMVCALKNGACHKWHSCGSKPNAENKQLLLNICTHTPHVPSASHFTYLLSAFVLHPRCQIASCSNWTH